MWRRPAGWPLPAEPKAASGRGRDEPSAITDSPSPPDARSSIVILATGAALPPNLTGTVVGLAGLALAVLWLALLYR